MKLMPPSMAASTASMLSASFVLRNTLPSDDAPKHKWEIFIPVFPSSLYLMISYGFWLSMLMQSYGDFFWWCWTIRYENRINLAFQCHLSDVLPIYLRSCPRHSLEKADEIGNVAESQLVCYLLDAEFFGE